MAVGDVALYRDTANSQNITNSEGEGTFIDFTWNTNTKQDSIFEKQGNNYEIKVTEAGKYLVIANIHSITNVTLRTNQQMKILVNGSVQADCGYGGSYGKNTANPYINTRAVCILDLAVDDLVKVQWAIEAESTTFDVTSNGSKSSLALVRLTEDSDVAYGRYSDATDNTSYSSATYDALPWDTVEEETDTSVIERQAGNEDIRLKETGFYLVCYGAIFSNQTLTRQTRTARATLAGTSVEQSYSYQYTRNSTTPDAGLNACFLINNESVNQDLNIEVGIEALETGTTCQRQINESWLHIMQLPSSVKKLLCHDSTAGQAFEGNSGTFNIFETVDEQDSGTFTKNSSSQAEVEEADDYLVFANIFGTRTTTTTTTRGHVRADIEKNGTVTDIGTDIAYIRGESGSAGAFDGGFNISALMNDLSANDTIDIVWSDVGDNGDDCSTVADKIGISILKVSSLVPSAVTFVPRMITYG